MVDGKGFQSVKWIYSGNRIHFDDKAGGYFAQIRL